MTLHNMSFNLFRMTVGRAKGPKPSYVVYFHDDLEFVVPFVTLSLKIELLSWKEKNLAL